MRCRSMVYAYYTYTNVLYYTFSSNTFEVIYFTLEKLLKYVDITLSGPHVSLACPRRVPPLSAQHNKIQWTHHHKCHHMSSPCRVSPECLTWIRRSLRVLVLHSSSLFERMAFRPSNIEDDGSIFLHQLDNF